MQSVSSLERALTHHIRMYLCNNYTNETIRKFSFIISLITCLFDASVVTFSLFTPQFMKVLHYDQFSINIIGGAIAIGMYLCLPLLGFLADTHGPVILAFLSVCLFFPGYTLASLTYTNEWHFIFMAIAFLMIGCGTSSVYFCSLLTCAKILPERKGLSISAPVAFFGLSSFLLTLVFKISFFHDKNGDLNIYKVFVTLSVMYLIIGVLNFCSSVIVTIEKDLLFKRENGHTSIPNSSEGPNERSALLERSSSIQSETSFMEPEEIIDHNIKYKKFLRDRSMYIMFVVLFFLAGPLELFITNMGSLSLVIQVPENSKEISYFVKLFSVFSTFTRLLVGITTDYATSKYITPITLLLASTVTGTIAFALVTIGYPNFSLITALVGVAYGGIFTLFPTISAEVWGVEILGSTWGLFLSAPAVGSLLFGVFYAVQYDKYCDAVSSSALDFLSSYCLSFPFAVITLGFFVAFILLMICWRTTWVKRGIFT